MKKQISLLLAALLLLTLLVGCGGSGSAKPAATGYAYDTDASTAPEAPMEQDSKFNITAVVADDALRDAKMIYRANIDLQTTDYETSEAAISNLVRSFGGYFESRSLSNRSSGYRYSDCTVRVPAESFESFCNQVGEMCHVVYMSSSAENITEAYYDTDSRLKTAQIKLERLQNLLANADNMADIITIESTISETEYEIESLSGTLRRYDALVGYATIYMTLSETYKLSENSVAPLTFGQRVSRALSDGLRDAGVFFEELIIGLAGMWVFVLVAAVLVVLLIRAVRKRVLRKKKKDEPSSLENPNHDQPQK